MNMTYLDITGAGIEFDTNGSKYRALQNVNLRVAKGEFVSLIGHSGCGKATVPQTALYGFIRSRDVLHGRLAFGSCWPVRAGCG